MERSLAVGDRLGGHLVLGHVDAVAEVTSVRTGGGAREVTISLPERMRGCVAAKGSIAVDGISLTVIAVGEDWFSTGIIPHTLTETTLRDVKAGVKVNLEADVLARYVLQILRTVDSQGFASGPPGLSEEFLREQGFA